MSARTRRSPSRKADPEGQSLPQTGGRFYRHTDQSLVRVNDESAPDDGTISGSQSPFKAASKEV